MKKIFLIALAIITVLSLSACGFKDVIEFEGADGEKYFYENADGIKTVTNYHPHKFWSLPDYQEMIQYGEGAGLENEGVVYFIYVVDTSMDSDDPRAYYSAEFDGETLKLLCEDGEYFADETTKAATVIKLFGLIKSDRIK